MAVANTLAYYNAATMMALFYSTGSWLSLIHSVTQ
jgi:hypothetical protein